MVRPKLRLAKSHCVEALSGLVSWSLLYCNTTEARDLKISEISVNDN